jgi:hypothetical protein
LHQEEDWYIAQCLEIDVAAAGCDSHGGGKHQELRDSALMAKVLTSGREIKQVTMPSSATPDRLYPHDQGFLAEAVA